MTALAAPAPLARPGWLKRCVAWALRRTRIARGWTVTSEATFVSAVATSAAFVAAHEGLVLFWRETRVVRLCALQAKLMEVLSAKCGREVRIWQLVCDDRGALGEACLGGWIVPFRIDLPAATLSAVSSGASK